MENSRNHSGRALERLSDSYAERVRELDELRARMDRIAEIVEPFTGELDQSPLPVTELKRVLELTRYVPLLEILNRD